MGRGSQVRASWLDLSQVQVHSLGSSQKPENRDYLKNAYRVLLTRARQGMVIYVPTGDRRDSTRLPEFYDGTFAYLKALGVSVIGSTVDSEEPR